MSFYEYEKGKEIAAKKPSFYTLIQAAMRRADSDNLEMLKGCWPDTWAELFVREYSPGGRLKEELKGDEK
jgi:hypothetical protein